MKLINRKFVWLILSLIVFSLQTKAQGTAFEKPVSKDDPKQAYQTLLKVDLFALGGTGYSGEIFRGEKALSVLLEDGEKSIEALKSLVKDASPEGGLYALIGLHALKCDCFEEEFKAYLAKPEPDKMVQRLSGCIGFSENAVDLAKKIKDGEFDSYFERKIKAKK